MKTRFIYILLSIFFLQGCILTKQERQNRRANRKLERLTTNYPQLLEKDTLRDTVTVLIPEIRIDTVFETSKDVSGVDSILMGFRDKLDSVTALKLGDQIKYYVTNRQVIEDTLIHEEDGVTIKIWQEGDLIRVSVVKPEETVTKIVEIPYDKIVKAKIPWYKTTLAFLTRNGIVIGLLIFLCWISYKGLRAIIKFYTGGKV